MKNMKQLTNLALSLVLVSGLGILKPDSVNGNVVPSTDLELPKTVSEHLLLLSFPLNGTQQVPADLQNDASPEEASPKEAPPPVAPPKDPPITEAPPKDPPTTAAPPKDPPTTAAPPNDPPPTEAPSKESPPEALPPVKAPTVHSEAIQFAQTRAQSDPGSSHFIRRSFGTGRGFRPPNRGRTVARNNLPDPEDGSTPESVTKSPQDLEFNEINLAMDEVVKEERQALQESSSPEDFVQGGPNLFTVTNTDVGFVWEKLPYREKYQWNTLKAPCRKFDLKVPDERADKSLLHLCIFRPYLEFIDDTELFIHYVGGPDKLQEHKELTVHGYVIGFNESFVTGSIIDRYFYGEVTIIDPESREINVYVVEEIKILTKLMRHNEKILTNILYVMENGKTPSAKYNAVVTKGASLMSFMVAVNPTESKLGSFLVFSTNHNSYITAGEPQMDEDEYGKVSFNAGGDKIIIDPVGTVNLITRTRQYIFRPHGKTVVREGTNVETLQEQEGSVAVSAFTSTSAYGCILPTFALSKEKKGGYICKVCLAADKLFRKHFEADGFKRGSPIKVLGRIIDKVSWIYRSTDWNYDGIPDNVGLDYDPQMTFWSYPGDDDVSGPERVNQTEMETMLKILSKKDFSDCCLGIGFTMKAFPGVSFGISSQVEGENNEVRGHAGVCGTKEDGFHHNLLVISANSKEGSYKPITEDQLVFVAAQEIGRVFGADTDGTGEEGCDDFTLGLNDTIPNPSKHSKKGHYLMWPEVLRTPDPEEKSFSHCSKQAVLKTLNTCASACFEIDKHPFCGNGIVETGEECDCGSEYNCAQQKCCFSRAGKYPCRKTGTTPCNRTITAIDPAAKATADSSAFLPPHRMSLPLPQLLLWSFLITSLAAFQSI